MTSTDRPLNPDDILATVRLQVRDDRTRTLTVQCSCNYHPDTTEGPEEDCPAHGRSVEWLWDTVGSLAAERDALQVHHDAALALADEWEQAADFTLNDPEISKFDPDDVRERDQAHVKRSMAWTLRRALTGDQS